MYGETNGTQQEAQAQQQETGAQVLQAPVTGQTATQGIDASAYEAQIAERDARIAEVAKRAGGVPAHMKT